MPTPAIDIVLALVRQRAEVAGLCPGQGSAIGKYLEVVAGWDWWSDPI